MFCPKCGKELESGSAFCPYCGENLAQFTSAQPNVQAPVSGGAPYANGSGYFAGGAAPNEVSSTQTLGIVALITAFFMPIVSFICGGIGLSKIKKLKTVATPEQQQQLAKHKKLSVAGISIAAVLTALSLIISIVWGVYVGKRVYNEFSGKDYSITEEQIEDFLEQYGGETEDQESFSFNFED